MKLQLTVAALVAAPFMALADAPAGGHALDCDQSMWIPVMSELRPGEVLYWNNRTCAIQEDGPEPIVLDEQIEE